MATKCTARRQDGVPTSRLEDARTSQPVEGGARAASCVRLATPSLA